MMSSNLIRLSLVSTETLVVLLGGLLMVLLVVDGARAQADVTHYVRYVHEGQESYGVLEGDTIRELEGNLFTSPRPTGNTVSVADVQLLAPCVPSKVIAVGSNYKSHIGNRAAPASPGLFAKYPTSIVGHEDNILMPSDALDLHYEGELVVVVGRQTSKITPQEAPSYIFGVTAGNDVSERGWQREDLQWTRAKGSDTFGPIGPSIAVGLDYNDLLVQTRLNGETRQSESTADLIFGVDAIVSYVSQYITLMPGDIIFTGTPGQTAAMQPGDVVEIEVAGVGVLRNTVASRD